MHGRGAHLEGFVRAVVSSGYVRAIEVRSCRAHSSSLAVARLYRPGPYHEAHPPAGAEGGYPPVPGITPAPGR